MVTGPIAIAYNVQGVDKLVLNADVAAKIFNGKITKWNDPAIAALNPGATLPATADQGRSSAPTSRAPPTTSPSTSRPPPPTPGPPSPARSGPASGEGKEKSAGVAEAVKATDGGIAYVEWSYAKDNKLGDRPDRQRRRRRRADRRVASARPSPPPSRTARATTCASSSTTPPRRPGAYPIVLVTYEIVCSKGQDADKADAGQGLPEALRLRQTPDRPRGHRLRAAAGRGPDQGRRPRSTPCPDPYAVRPSARPTARQPA